MPWFTLCWLIVVAVVIGVATSRTRPHAWRLVLTAVSLALLTAPVGSLLGNA